jgi:hypothetical protein
LEIGCGEMVWASPLHEEAITQARINHREGSAQLLARAESSREDRGQGGDFVQPQDSPTASLPKQIAPIASP